VKTVVCDAISRRLRLSFTYAGKVRVVEPHLCGRTTTGQDLLLAYQVGGHSSSGDLPRWRNYRLSEIHDLRVLEDRFDGPRPGYVAADERFVVVYCRVPSVVVLPK